MADDIDIRVRYQLAFSLGEFEGDGRIAALAGILRRDPTDRWLRIAAFSSLGSGGGELFGALVADRPLRTSDEGRTLLFELARYIGRQNKQTEVAGLLAALDTISSDEAPLAGALVRGLGEGLAGGPGALDGQLAAAGNERARRILSDLLADARTCAADEVRPTRDRIDAIRVLVLGDYAVSGPLLMSLVSNRQPQDVQSAAIGALGRFSDPEIARTLIEAWPGLSPRLRGEAAEAMFSRAAWLQVLLAAAGNDSLSLADLDPARLKSLENHPNAAIRAAAQPLMAKLKVGRRQDVVAAYQGTLSASGDASRGRQVFQKICASCHRLDGVGHEIGPSLASFRNRGAEAILVNVLDPNREVNPQYVNYIVMTEDGRSMTGMIAAETANSVTLKRADDVSDVVERSQIEDMRATGLSIMPEGLEKQIDQAQMADLLAYLVGALQ
jgi:putative heme-binding domain-containing protein